MLHQALADTALVVLPTYNEAENIERLVELILQQDAPLHVVVVDDNSPDGTGELADRLAARDPRVAVIHRSGKLGLGTAYIAGFQRALSLGYGYAITMDADFSHHPRYLPSLLALMPGCDLAIGSRYVPGGGTEGWPLRRRVLSSGANAFARTLLGLHAHDCTAGFRCYRRQVLERIELETIFSSGYSFLVEMLTRCERHGFRVDELPIIFRDREAGASKISRAEIWRSIYTVFRLKFTRLPWDRWAARHRRVV